MRTVRPFSFFSVLTSDFVFEFIIGDLVLHSPELFWLLWVSLAFLFTVGGIKNESLS